AVGKSETGSERNLGGHNAMSAVERLLDREHVHGSALALRIAVLAAGQLRHHAFGIHAAGQHVTMVAIAGNDGVARLDCHLHPDDDRLLPDIEVAKSPDQAHAVELTRLLLEPADQQHLAIGAQLLLLIELGNLGRLLLRPTRASRLGRWFVAGNGHASPQARWVRRHLSNSRKTGAAEAHRASRGGHTSGTRPPGRLRRSGPKNQGLLRRTASPPAPE